MKLNPKHALVVLSGGQDSTTCLFWALQHYEKVHAITFDYGQRHRIEIQSAAVVAQMAGIGNSHEILNVAGILNSASPLTSDTPLERYTDFEAMAEIVGDKVEKTFVPMRNSLFLTIAANRAVALGCGAVVTGICQEDNANYPDCTEAFRRSIEKSITTSLGIDSTSVENAFFVEAPLMYLSKAKTVHLAKTLPGCMEALAYSHTSYDGKYPPTDHNHSNLLRAHGFLEAGEPDPLVVRAWREGLMPLPESANYDGLRTGSYRAGAA